MKAGFRIMDSDLHVQDPRFPRLRVGFLETSGSWLIWLLWRLDDHSEMYGPDESWTLSMKPSDYFRRQGWIAFEPEEAPVKYLVDYLGEDNIVISTDYPHPDCMFPEAMQSFIALDGIDDRVRQKILWDNCARLYNLDPQTGEARRATEVVPESV
jgi:predicted TIM-barrel fold metal-dependent hydrolase